MITRVLANRFLYAPVSLGGAIRRFQGLDKLVQFRRLVDTYFPGEADSFPLDEPDKAAAQFIKKFSAAYFPISVYSFNKLESLLEHVPNVSLQGVHRYYYDTGGQIDAQLLAGALVECPFEDADNTVLVEMFMKTAGEETAAILLPGGFPLEDLEEMLKGSPYEDLLWWCRWLHGRTGNRWLDSDNYPIPWDTEMVLGLAADYKGYLEINKEMKRFNSRLGHGFRKLASEVLDYIASQRDETLKENLTDDGEKNENKPG